MKRRRLLILLVPVLALSLAGCSNANRPMGTDLERAEFEVACIKAGGDYTYDHGLLFYPECAFGLGSLPE